MKPKSETKKKAGGSVATGRGLGRGLARLGSKENKGPAISPSKAVIAPPTVIHLRDEAGQTLFQIQPRGDGTSIAVPSSELVATSVRLEWRVSLETLEISRALSLLAKLPPDLNKQLCDGSLFPRMTIEGMVIPHLLVHVGCILEAFTKHLSSELGQLMSADSNAKPRTEAAENLKTRLSGAIDALLEQSDAGLHGNTKFTLALQVKPGVCENLSLPRALIHELYSFVTTHHALPSMAQLREALTARCADEIALWKEPARSGVLKAKFWTDFFKDAGLDQLTKGKPTPKKATWKEHTKAGRIVAGETSGASPIKSKANSRH